MPGDFLDTSALAKHYHSEDGSAEVDRLWSDPGRQLFVSGLSMLEIVSVFAAKVRAGLITQDNFEAFRGRIAADLTRTKRILVARILPRHYREAEELLRAQGVLRRLRTLDALQLTVALDLRRRGLVDRVVGADKDMLVVAAVVGLDIFNPQYPEHFREETSKA